MGRHKLIESPDKLWELFNEYKQETKSYPVMVSEQLKRSIVLPKGYEGDLPDNIIKLPKEKPLTLEGFENYVADIPGMPMDLGDYFANSNDAYKDFSTICQRIRRVIRQDQIEGGMTGIYNPSITQRLNGLVDKSEQKVIKEQPLFGDEDNE